MDTCETCRWSRDTGDGLRCHRHPPVAIIVSGVSSWEFPRVLPRDYCGDHDAEPAAKAIDGCTSPDQSQHGTGNLEWAWYPHTDLWRAASKTGANWHVRYIEDKWRWARASSDWWEQEEFDTVDEAKAACQWKEDFLMKGRS